MYTVPFIVWQSPKWQQAFPRDFSTMLSRPYSSSQLIYTWADLAGLRFEGYDATRSLVSSEFQIRPRLIGDPQQPKSLRNYADAVQQPNETQSALAQKKSQQACEGEPPHCG